MNKANKLEIIITSIWAAVMVATLSSIAYNSYLHKRIAETHVSTAENYAVAAEKRASAAEIYASAAIDFLVHDHYYAGDVV